MVSLTSLINYGLLGISSDTKVDHGSLFSCYLIDCGVDEPAGVPDLGEVGNTEQKSQPCRVIASLEKVLTSWGRMKCSWASVSMECPFNSPPEAPCRRRSLINIKQHFSYCWWGAESVRPPRGTQRLIWQPHWNRTTLTFSSTDISVIREGHEKQPCWIISRKLVLGSVGTADHQGSTFLFQEDQLVKPSFWSLLGWHKSKLCLNYTLLSKLT